jgi:hypothetical protein
LSGTCEECQGSSLLQRRAISQRTAVPPIVHEVLRSPGQPLDPATRAFMEPRFGHDFSQVKIHADVKAAKSAHTLHAAAYTVGRDIVFGVGQFALHTGEGRKLLAHELTHVVQQKEVVPSAYLSATSLAMGSTNDPLEREAVIHAERLTAMDAEPAARLTPSNVQLRRQIDFDAEHFSAPVSTERKPGTPLPFREATELSECLRIMGQANMEFCRQTVLGEKPPAPAVTPVAASTVTKSGPATCDDGVQMFCNTGNKGCPTFAKGMTGAWANICYRCGPKGVFHRNKDEGTGVVRVGCGDTLTVISQDNPDCSIEIKAIDHGPRGSTGNLVDLHPAAAEKLWKCAGKKAKGKFRCDNFKMPVSVSATENTCPA